MRSGLLQIVAMGVCLAGQVSAQFAEPDESNVSASFRPRPLGPFPNVGLPAWVVAEPGKLTIFADHAHPDPSGIPLYYINRTKERREIFHASENAMETDLETKDAKSGVWQRAQAHFGPGGCASMGAPVMLEPGLHYMSFGYQPEGGSKGVIRFRDSYLGIVSNEGPGLWSKEDLAASALDHKTAKEEPLFDCLKFPTPPHREVPVPNEDMERNLAVLELRQAWKRDALFHFLVNSVRAGLQARAEEDPEFAARALKRLDEVAGKGADHPAKADEFHGQCLAALKADKREGFGTAAKHVDLAWAGIEWLAKKDEMTSARWKECYTLMRERLPVATVQEQERMAKLVADTSGAEEAIEPERALGVANEHLNTAFLVEGASPRFPAFREACMECLASRRLYDELLGIGEKEETTEGRLLVLKYVCIDRISRHPRQDKDERLVKFWKDCLSRDLMGAVQAMYVGVKRQKVYVDGWLADELQRRVELFAAEAKAGPWPSRSIYTGSPFIAMNMLFGEDDWKKGMLLRLQELGKVQPAGESAEQRARRDEVAQQATRLLSEME